VIVGVAEEGKRLDNFLLKRLKGSPKAYVYRVIRTGEVRVNGKRVKPAHRLSVGDQVRMPAEGEGAPRPSSSLAERIRRSVLHEDRHLLVVNKPPGLAVHGGRRLPFGLVEALRDLRPDVPELQLAHRLDKPTSGCLLLAKDSSSLTTLSDLMRSGRIEKTYLAVVRGRFGGKARTVRAPLRRSTLAGGERLVTVDPEGKPAESHFEPVDRTEHASLVSVRLKTGRMHQIRVHAAHEGHPLAGDDKYGSAEFNRFVARHGGGGRLALHAYQLVIPRRRGTALTVKAPLDEELRALVEGLGLSVPRA
jgi:23S rRNA pseudouridine955/2504/2580 synthase